MLLNALIIIGVVLTAMTLYQGFKKDAIDGEKFDAMDLFFKKSSLHTQTKKQTIIEGFILLILTLLVALLKIFPQEIKEILG